MGSSSASLFSRSSALSLTPYFLAMLAMLSSSLITWVRPPLSDAVTVVFAGEEGCGLDDGAGAAPLFVGTHTFMPGRRRSGRTSGFAATTASMPTPYFRAME
jgi:hypothetical protein